MKKNLINICRGILIFLLPLYVFSCSYEVDIHSDIPDEQDYINIYLPQAGYDSPQEKNIYLSDEVQSFEIGVHYGGPNPATNDYNVNLKVNADLVDTYNQQHGTNYSMMPAGSYQLESTEAVIKSGTFSSNVKLNITSVGFFEVGREYLLPVSIQSVDRDIRINEKLRNAYFLVKGSFKPGNVPREKVYSFGTKDVGILFCKDNDLIQRDMSGNLMLYQPDEHGIYSTSRQIGSGWDGVTIMFYMPDNRFLARKPDNNIEQYNIDNNYNFTGQRTIGWGWGDAVTIFPFKNLMVFNTSPAGALTKFPLSQGGDWDYGNIGQVGSGFDVDKHLFCYENSIIGVDAAGNMWEIPVSDAGTLGNKRQIGSGWDMYEMVIRKGTDLLALDSNGDLWRYAFDPNSFWPLK